MIKKKIVFLTGTRADFGKIKSLIEITNRESTYEVFIFVTGMHLMAKYGYTVDEIVKYGYKNIYKFINHTSERSMDQNLAKTVQGFSDFIREYQPDLIVIHGDRLEALAGAIVGSLNNILVAHLEGGEVSGTVDELIRHAVSKMSHTHFVSNTKAKQRLIQMGELEEAIFEIGSPDVDIMVSQNLPSLGDAMTRFEISFKDYGIVLFHPVTTEIENLRDYSKNFVDALLASCRNFIVVYPNNDMGSSEILNEYKRLEGNKRFKIFPSIRFEYFLVLLKYAKCIVGNSSAGIREAPYYGVPSVNIGTRQFNRALHHDIINCDYQISEIIEKIELAFNLNFEPVSLFGSGKSDLMFKEVLSTSAFWSISKQKQFKDL